jgi:hypothetical protein
VIRASAWLMAVGLPVALPAVLTVREAYATITLPQVAVFIEPPPSFNPASELQGATQSQVARLFTMSTASTVTAAGVFCVRYRYSPRLSYVLHYRQGTVESIWLTEDGFVPYRCEGILVRESRIPMQSWLPTAAFGHESRCGCPPGPYTTCAVP